MTLENFYPAETGALLAAIQSALQAALTEAQKYCGATAPNPPVGAAALDAHGNFLSVQAHQRAGTPHAEALVLTDCKMRGILSQIHTLVVTLEPCNHTGKTPPCTHAIIQAQIPRVVYACSDPNPNVAGGGAAALEKAGVQTFSLSQLLQNSQIPNPPELSALKKDCERLIAPFVQWSQTGLPWVTVKQAFTTDGSMIPPTGQKTFTSASSLKLAHELRKRADAILTGSGTVLADRPEFTVRHVPDHPGKRRWILVMDRRGRVVSQAADWVQDLESKGFYLKFWDGDLEGALRFLGEQGVVEVLVEAGPHLSAHVLGTEPGTPNAGCGFWNQNVVIGQSSNHKNDQVEVKNHVHWNHSKSGKSRSP